MISTKFDYEWQFKPEKSKNLLFFVSAIDNIFDRDRIYNLDSSTDRQLNVERLINNLSEISASDASDSFVGVLEKALSDNGEKLISRDGHGRELTEEEIEQIEGVEIKTKN